ncbi:histidinol phosphate aminotransferase apoenzyme [Archaeoglobus sulfaticallidus PM70-1]|uniref:Histidinol-phosphate aminotransferase n=1 Tax=Archaeoglobus sulfaticallidus PM70-1 TaxID=387631 RepID=N0BPD6_9EURY|nr:histidinol-phosphate transaminase [Archaeoglobus sulfaticallidus]AGK62225.1 histidinol phosphate aminotransferase apoenzyme [Archaeoglobus sulfaticallidus PM70-1]
MSYHSLVRDSLSKATEYVPGKDADYVKRKYGVERVVKLASNENPYGASPKTIESFQKFTAFHVYPPKQPEELIEKISEYIGVDSNRIVICAGIDGVLECLFKIFIERGDSVAIAPPTFPYYHILADISGAKKVYLKRDQNFMIAEKDENAKLTIVCSPNNPTGNTEREEIVREIVDGRGIVFIDEAYAEFSDDDMVDFTEEENVVLARTFSKAFGLANLRIGYAVVPEWMKKYFMMVNTPFPISTPAINAAISALEDIDYMRDTVEKIRDERDRVYRELKNVGVEVYPSQANFLFFSLKQFNLPASQYCEELMKRGVIVRDCSSFIGCDEYSVRVSIGRKEDNDVFLDATREILEDQE